MGRTRQHWDSETERVVKSLDALSEFDQYGRDVLPVLRQAINENWTTRRMRKEMASLHQALVIQSAMDGNIAAVRDVLDRDEGQPHCKEIKTQRYAMTREELVEFAYRKLILRGRDG